MKWKSAVDSLGVSMMGDAWMDAAAAALITTSAYDAKCLVTGALDDASAVKLM